MPKEQPQETVLEQREWLRVALASIGDGVITTDTNGCITFMNPVAEALTGWRLAEAVGLPLHAIFTIVNQETWKTVENPTTRALREGIVVGLANHTLLISKDGTERPIDDSAAPIRNDNGDVVGVVLVFRDVSERRRAEQALRQSEERFRSLVEGVQDYAIFMLDPQGNILGWNKGAERIKGYRPEEIIGKHFSCFYPKEALARNWPEQELRMAAADGRFEDEGWRVRKDGSLFWANVIITALRNDRGELIGYSKITRDLTERKRAEEQGRQLERMKAQAEASVDLNRRKDEFLAMLAHELRNPLAPLRNALHVLQVRTKDAKSVEEVWEIMDRQVSHLTHLVGQLLDVSRIMRGKVSLTTERLDLARLVQTVAKDHQAAFAVAGLSLEVDVPELPLWVLGDATRLTQTLGNLLGNAVKFTPKGGKVSIRLSINDGNRKAVLIVRDTGVGIEPEMLPRLFETFSQADRSLDRTDGGLGLGLSVVKGLVELHGGRIEAKSGGPGAGAEFTVWLPREEELPAIRPSATPAPARAPSKQLRVLVVEDNRDAAESLRMLLELYGFQVIVAYTGPDGVATAKREHPDVVVCDIGLPGMDGFAVADALRKNGRMASARLIAVTGYGQDQDKQRALQAGFDAHLVKPADPSQLLALLEGGEESVKKRIDTGRVPV